MCIPERLALQFFIFLEYLNLGRIGASLIWIAIFAVLFVIVTLVVAKEIRWNNKHLDLDVIQFNGDAIKVCNFREEKHIPIADIEEVSIINKDTVLRIKYKDNKSVTADYLEDNRKAYESLKDILSPLNANIRFQDSAAKEEAKK